MREKSIYIIQNVKMPNFEIDGFLITNDNLY